MNSKQAKALLEKMELSVRADDPRMNRRVHIIHQDGSSLIFTYAYMVRCHNWLFVFTEHQGPHYFSINDLSYYSQSERIHDLEVVNDLGETITIFKCSNCGVETKEPHSVYDKYGNREDMDVCELCWDVFNPDVKLRIK